MTVDPKKLFCNHFAFLVGIDEYDHFSDLRGAHSDAKALRDALYWVGYPVENLLLVPKEKTSLSDLLNGVEDFLKLAKNKSRKRGTNPEIIVFWAGHGVPAENDSFLIARDTKRDFDNLSASAISLHQIAERFRKEFRASLTMFFDVCHSIPPRLWEDLTEYPVRQILTPMCNTVRATFVGVSTFAYEVWVKGHQGVTRRAGILSDAIQRGVCGDACHDNDKGHLWDPDRHFEVTDKHLVSKLEEAVRLGAKAIGEDQRLFVLTSHAGERRTIGFAVRSFAEARLTEERLAPEADLLARLVVRRSGPSLDDMTPFGVDMTELVTGLIRRESSGTDFSLKARFRTRKAILELRKSERLESYVYFLLYCHEQAKHNDAARKILEHLYQYIISQNSDVRLKNLIEHLRIQYCIFAVRDALPWSCGIRVLHGTNDQIYAQIIRKGEPCAAQRTFVTTGWLQERALLEVWRGDPKGTMVHDGGLVREYVAVGSFHREFPMGTTVWVRIEFDERDCDARGCEVRDPSTYVPMRILLGLKGSQENCWDSHWHFRLGKSKYKKGQEPQWVARVKALMDQCHRWLETWADSGVSEEEEHAVIEWLYHADRVTRIWDELRLREVMAELLVGLRQKDAKARSAQRVARALGDAMGSEAGAGWENVSDEDAYREVVEGILTDYKRWRTGQSVKSSDVVRRAEMLALLLEAVTAEEAVKEVTADRFVKLVEMGSEDEVEEKVSRVVAGFAEPAPARARRSVLLLVDAINDFIQKEGANIRAEQQQSLQGWSQFASDALQRDRAEGALEEFFAQLSGSIGVGTRLLAEGFLNATGLRSEFAGELDEIETWLRRGKDEQDTRDAADEMYRRLHQLYLSGLPRGYGTTQAGSAFLLMLNALLWPESKAVVLQSLTSDAVDWETALRMAHRLADPG